MSARALGVCVAGLLLVVSAWGEGPAVPAPSHAEVVLAEGDRVPLTLLWARDGETTVSVRLREPASSVQLPAGEGCLVAVRQAFAPVPRTILLAPGEAASFEPFAWRPGVAVVGRVTGPEGTPLAAEVRLEKPGEESPEGTDLCTRAQLEGGITRGITDDDGRFSLGPIAPGAWEVLATAEGREAVTLKVVVAAEPRTHDVGTLVLREVAELDLSLDQSRVGESPPFRLTVSRLDERAIKQSEEWLQVREVELAGDAPVMLRLDPGSYRLVLSKEDTDVHFVQHAALVAGYNILVLRPWPIRVYGTVSDSEGAVEGAELELMCDGHSTEVTTSHDGEYEVRLWTPTRCGASVRDPEGRVDSRGLDLRSAELGDEVELSFELPENGVAGTVVDAASQEPIAGARVSLVQVHTNRSGGGRRSATTDGEGRFEFTGVRGATADSTVIEARAEGYLPAREEVVVVEGGGPLEVRLELRPGEGVTGRVVGPGGEPVAGAVVGCCAVDPGGSLTVQTETDPGGEFTLEAAPGVTVLAAATGYALGWAQASPPDETTVVRLAPRAHPVLLRLLDADGEPVEGAALVFSTAGAGFLPGGLLWLDAHLNGAQARTDDGGRLVTSALPGGLYRVWHLGPGGAPRELGSLPVPMSGELTLHLPPE